MLNTKNEIKSLGSIIITIAMVFVIICFINLFINQINKRFDFTKEHIYTLSDYSKNLVRSLDDIVTIEFYITKKLPPHVVGMKQHITDLLNEYDAYGKGNIQVIIDSLNSSQENHNRMAQLGIPRFQMNIIEQDKLQTVEAYSGIALFYDNKTEVIPMVLSINTLEYDLSLALKKITSKTIPEIGILTNDVETFKKTHQNITKSLEKQYNVTLLNQNETISNNIKTLVISNPNNVTANTTYAIDQFIMNGGNALFLVPTIKVNDLLEPEANNTGLNELIQHYGITIQNELVLDKSYAYATFSEGYFNFALPYPLWPKLLKQHFNSNHISLKNLESVVLPWSSPLTFHESLASNLTATILASSTKESWTMSDPIDLNPRQSFTADKSQQYPMIISLEGEFTSFYNSKPLALSQSFIPNGKPAKLVFIGNEIFASDQMSTQFANNKNLYLNLIDWLTLETDLLGIPNRVNLDHPIQALSNELRTFIKWFTSLIIPITIIMIGVIRYWINKEKKHTYE